jgi:molybdopterin-guanine dinucleotide biosynthesis protein A
MAKKYDQLNIKGAILAGGRASRMGGMAKGLLTDSSGQSIIAHLINQMHLSGINDIVISANDPNSYMDLGLPAVPDIRQDIGPVAGIEATLLYFQGRCDAVMLLPCDMPNIEVDHLLFLKMKFVDLNRKIVFAAVDEFFSNPLCAIVHNHMTPHIVSAINQGQRKVQQLWQELKAEQVVFSNKAAFLNLNSFSDIRFWRNNNDKKKSLC